MVSTYNATCNNAEDRLQSDTFLRKDLKSTSFRMTETQTS